MPDSYHIPSLREELWDNLLGQKVTKKPTAQTPRRLGLRYWFSLCMRAADGPPARPREGVRIFV